MRKDFYTITDELGTPSDTFEKFFGQLEGDAVPALKDLISPTPKFPEADARAKLARWIALQHLRSEGMRAADVEMRAGMIQLIVGISGKQRLRQLIESGEEAEISDARLDAEWADLTQPGGTNLEPDPRDHLSSIMDMLPGVSNLIYNSPWMLQRFTRKTLVTSDHPVFLIRSPDARPWEGVGLANAFGYGLALDRHTGLIVVTSGVGDGVPDRVVPATAFHAKLFNCESIRNARKALYHHPDDDPRQSTDGSLPRERHTEMEAISEGFPDEGWGESTGDNAKPPTPLPSGGTKDPNTWTINDLPWPIPGRTFTFLEDR